MKIALSTPEIKQAIKDERQIWCFYRHNLYRCVVCEDKKPFKYRLGKHFYGVTQQAMYKKAWNGGALIFIDETGIEYDIHVERNLSELKKIYDNSNIRVTSDLSGQINTLRVEKDNFKERYQSMLSYLKGLTKAGKKVSFEI